MEKLRITAVIIAVLLGVAVVVGCSEDEESPVAGGPTTGSVAGTVTFTGDWPASGEVQVSIYSSLQPPYVPTGAPDAFTDPIAPGTNEYDYKLDGLDKGDYMAIFVSWRDPQNPGASRLLGMYWTNHNESGINDVTGLPLEQPTGVTIADGNLNLTDHDITADLNLAP
jgi:hypothetical protein